MIQTAEASLKVGNYVSACLLIRALIENSAILNAFATHCRNLDETVKVEQIDDIAMKFILSSRAETAQKKAVNILTHLDRYATKINPSIRDTYDHLSNWCHPNYEGTFNPFIEMKSGRLSPSHGPSSLDQKAISTCLPIAVASIRIEATKAFGATLPSALRQEIEEQVRNETVK